MGGVASCAASNSAGVVTKLMVAQLGASTPLIVSMDLGQNLTGVTLFPNPESPKYFTFGFIRYPPTFDI